MALKAKVEQLEKWLARQTPVSRALTVQRLLEGAHVVYGQPDDPPIAVLTDEELDAMWPEVVKLLEEVYARSDDADFEDLLDAVYGRPNPE